MDDDKELSYFLIRRVTSLTDIAPAGGVALDSVGAGEFAAWLRQTRWVDVPAQCDVTGNSQQRNVVLHVVIVVALQVEFSQMYTSWCL